MISVEVSVPGSKSYQNFSNIEVDTGSTGLRILSSALSIALPSQSRANAECYSFLDSYVWGSVDTATVP